MYSLQVATHLIATVEIKIIIITHMLKLYSLRIHLVIMTVFN